MNARFGAGRPSAEPELTREQLDWLTAPRTLINQVGLSLPAKVQQFNDHWGHRLSTYDLRKLYRQLGITQQQLHSRLGGVRLPHHTTQSLKILQLQRRLAALEAGGYEVMQATALGP